MEVRFKPETESRLHELASQSGLPTDDLVEDAMAAYLAEVADIRSTLDVRYDEFKNGAVELVDGETFFEPLRRRAQESTKRPRGK